VSEDITTDAVRYTEQVLGVTVFDYQKPALETKANVTTGAGGRRSGKTLMSQAKSCHTAMAKRGSQIIVTSANEGSVRRWISEAADLIAASKIAREATINVEALRIGFANGSELRGVPPTSSALRGYGRRVAGVVIDEASLCSPTLWQDARYLLLDNVANGAWAFMVGPPSCSRDHWFRREWDAGNSGDLDRFSFQWSTLDNPRLDRGWLARELARLNTIEAAGEIRGEWIEDGLQFFSHMLIESITADLDLPEMAHLFGPARPIAAFDFGLVYDQSAAVYAYRLPVRHLNPDHDPTRPVFVLLPYVWPAGEPLNTVVEAIIDCPARAAAYGLEQNGVSGMPSQEVQRRIAPRKQAHREAREWNSRATTQAGKLAGYGAWRWLFERGQAVIPRHPQLIRQLAGLTLDTAGRGGKIEASDPATHDDIADAMMLAALPYPGRDRVNTRISELAGPRAIPDSPVEELDLDIVQTGAGLNIYRRPPLQSIGDPRVTLPRGVGPAVYGKDEHADLRKQMQAALG
jgi:hypothetical protein